MNSQTISIRFNEQEIKELEDLKELLGTKGIYGEDSLTIKLSIRCALNVIHSFFGSDLKDIFKYRIKDEIEDQAVKRFKR